MLLRSTSGLGDAPACCAHSAGRVAAVTVDAPWWKKLGVKFEVEDGRRIRAICPACQQLLRLSAGRTSNLTAHLRVCPARDVFLARPDVRQRLNFAQFNSLRSGPGSNLNRNLRCRAPSFAEAPLNLSSSRPGALAPAGTGPSCAEPDTAASARLTAERGQLWAALAQFATAMPLPVAAVVSEPVRELLCHVTHFCAPNVPLDVWKDIMPSRHTIARRQDAAWCTYLEEQRARLRGQHPQLFIDGWTSPAGTPLLGSTLSWMQRGVPQQVAARVMELTPASSAVAIQRAIRIAIEDELGCPLHELVSAISDRGSNMQAALHWHTALCLVSGSCIVHAFMRAMASCESTQLRIHSFFEAVRSLVGLYGTTATDRRRALMDRQRACGMVPVMLIRASSTRWNYMYRVLTRLQRVWPALAHAAPGELRLTTALHQQTIGALSASFDDISTRLLPYLSVVDTWVKVFEGARMPTLSLVSRFRVDVCRAFSRPCRRPVDSSDGVDTAVNVVEEWRAAVFRQLLARLDVRSMFNGGRLEALCAAAELLDPRTASDFRLLGPVVAACSSGAAMRRLELAQRTVHVCAIQLLGPVCGGRRSVSDLESHTHAVDAALGAWLHDESGRSTAAQGACVTAYLQGKPEYATLAAVADVLLAIHADTTMQERAFSVAKRCLRDTPTLSSVRAGKLVAMRLGDLERRHRTAPADDNDVMHVPDVIGVYEDLATLFPSSQHVPIGRLRLFQGQTTTVTH